MCCLMWPLLFIATCSGKSVGINKIIYVATINNVLEVTPKNKLETAEIPGYYGSTLQVGENNNNVIEISYYVSKNGSISFAVPSDWRLVDSDSLEFGFSTPPYHKNNYFSLTVNQKMPGQLDTPNDYMLYSLQEFNVRNDSIFGVQYWKRSLGPSRELHKMMSMIDTVAYQSIVTESDRYILDFTYAYTGNNISEAMSVFAFVGLTLYINGQPVAPPGQQSKSYEVGVGWK